MLNLIVCGLKEVDEYIDEVDGVISIMNPGDRHFWEPPSIFDKEQDNPHCILRLDFDDTCPKGYKLGQQMVEVEMIEQAIDFSEDICGRSYKDTNILVHCYEGISRSSAMAISIYTALTQDLQYAVERVLEQRPRSFPNIQVIRLADELLEMQGQMIEAVLEVFYIGQQV